VAGLAEHVQSALSAARQALSGTGSSLVQIQQAGSNLPLFIFHGLGGDEFFARQLATHLGLDQPVYGFHNASGNIISEREGSLEELATRYVKDLVAFQPNGLYCLTGYSFGGFLAYEVARQLLDRGSRIGYLAIIDTGPSSPGDFSFKANLSGVLDFLRNIPWWVWEDLLECRPSEMLRRIRRKVRELRKRLKKTINPNMRTVAIADLEDIFELSVYPKDYVQAMEYHLELLRGYQPSSYSGPLTLYRARTQPLFGLEKADLGWGTIVGKSIEIVRVPGNHETIIREPHVRFLAMAMRASIEKITGDHPGPTAPFAFHLDSAMALKSSKSVL
jgi:thioesterase domain-containing protein